MAHPERAGYEAEKLPAKSGESLRPDPVRLDHAHELERVYALNKLEIGRVVFVAVAAAAFWFLGGLSSPYITAIGALCALAGGFPIFAEAYENIAQRRMTMELSMAIAIVAALAIREIFTALIITLFVLIAEILERLTVGRGRRAIQHLVDMLPKAATVRTPTGWSDVGIEQVQAGDVVLVRPGGRIPVDGSIVGGHSFVEQAAITGESLAVEKFSGATVYAGTINQSGALEIRVDRLGRDTTFGKIIEEVERAEKSRAPIQKIADRLAGYLVYFALGAAALTFLITHNVRSTISVVIVAGACGIAAGTPLAILGGIGQAARRGVIIKGGIHLESLARIDTVLLDKTGTLSYGTPEVIEISPAAGASERALLEAAAIAESRSEHPVAKAILKKSRERGFVCGETGGFDYQPGKGVIAEHAGEAIVVGTKVLLQEVGVDLSEWRVNGSSGAVGVSRGGRFLGALRVGDTLRPESRGAVSALKGMGLKTILITGDARGIADGVGAALGVDQVAAELLPSQKLERVEELLAEGHTLAMVGDGINDAPALMKANVGVAMGSGTDIARESANILLIGNDLSKFVETVMIARQCRRIILQNFTGTLVVDGIGMGLAAAGILNPLLAAFIHVSSELIFILNSARLLSSSESVAGAMKSNSVGSDLENVALATQLGK
jgi:heavy metal translocating P-type ATPase